MMCEKFRSVLNYVAGGVAYGIWNDLNPGINKDIDTIDSMKEFIDFFAFAISENVIVEYDCEKNCPVFSGDQPIVVANRIFGDFFEKNPDIPKKSPSNSDDFIAYMFYKTGWAVLHKGTCLILPET